MEKYLYICTRPQNVEPKDWHNCKICKVATCGYSFCFEPNERWKEQGGMCQYEHCIENMEIYEEEGQKCIELGWITKDGYPDINRYIATYGNSGKSCPIFGHDCPGGEKQVLECVDEEI